MPPPQLDETPGLPPSVSSQMGAGEGGGGKTPFSGVTAMMGQQAASPSGALKSGLDAVKKVLENLAKLSKVGAPFAARMTEMADSWMAEEAKSGTPGGASTASTEKISAKPPDGGPPNFVG